MTKDDLVYGAFPNTPIEQYINNQQNMTILHIFNIYYFFILLFEMANYKRLFLSGYSYYITITTYQRRAILIKNIELLRESFKESKRYYRYKRNYIVILSDYIHIIITPENYLEYNFSK